MPKGEPTGESTPQAETELTDNILQPIEKIVEAVKSKPRTEISIGPGINTLPKAERGDTCYICFDPAYGQRHASVDYKTISLDSLRSCAKDILEKGVIFSDRWAEDIGLPDSCADVIKLSNVLNAPKMDDVKRLEIMEEARRILKKSGEIRVSATNTPDAFPIKDITCLAEKVKMKIEVIFHVPEESAHARKLTEEEIKALFEITDDISLIARESADPGSYIVKLTYQEGKQE